MARDLVGKFWLADSRFLLEPVPAGPDLDVDAIAHADAELAETGTPLPLDD